MVNGYNLNNIRPRQVPYMRAAPWGSSSRISRLIEKKRCGRTFCVKSGVVDQLLESAFFLSFSPLVQSDLQAKPEII